MWRNLIYRCPTVSEAHLLYSLQPNKCLYAHACHLLVISDHKGKAEVVHSAGEDGDPVLLEYQHWHCCYIPRGVWLYYTGQVTLLLAQNRDQSCTLVNQEKYLSIHQTLSHGVSRLQTAEVRSAHTHAAHARCSCPISCGGGKANPKSTCHSRAGNSLKLGPDYAVLPELHGGTSPAL